jgi:hypothetical protein
MDITSYDGKRETHNPTGDNDEKYILKNTTLLKWLCPGFGLFWYGSESVRHRSVHDK